MAKQQQQEQTEGGSWTNGPFFFEQAVGDKSVIKACVTTSPEGVEFVSIREWRTKRDGTPYFTRNGILLPREGFEPMRDAFVAAMNAQPEAKKPTPKKAPAKKVKAAA